MLRALAIPVLLGAVLAGCIGSDEPVAPGAAASNLTNSTKNLTGAIPTAITLKVATTGIYPINPAFDPATLEVKEGANVTIELTNGDPNPVVGHNWVLTGVDGAETEGIESGGSTSVSFIAPKAGEYEFICSIGDHKDRGMVGKLTVTA